MRLIDANKLMEHLTRCIDAGKGLLRAVCVAIKCFVEQMPTVDAVEVVRCKNCKHRGDYGCPMYHEEYVEWDDDGYREFDIVEHDRTRDDGFCDLGERLDNE